MSVKILPPIEHIDIPPHGYVHYIDHLGTDDLIIAAARACYKSKSKGDEADRKLLFHLYRNRHTTPFEQVNITFNIRLPIFVMRQLARHRTFRYNETSLRYSEAPDEFFNMDQWRLQDDRNRQGSKNAATGVFNTDHNYIIPDVDGSPHQTVDIESVVRYYNERQKDLYDSMRHADIARELARVVLPLGTYTEIYINCDLHNLLHFFRLRLDPHAQKEIRDFAAAMYEITKPLYPWTFEAFDRFKMVMVDTESDEYNRLPVGEQSGQPTEQSPSTT